MDHLPTVISPHNPVTIKYLGGDYEHTSHGGYGFTDFPVSQAVEDIRTNAATVTDATRAEAARVLQVRFFFGMIREVLGLPVILKDFLRDDGGDQIITTTKLNEYLERWKLEMDELKNDATGERLELRNERVIACLQQMIDNWRAFPEFTATVGAEIELSIQILGSTLEHALDLIAGIPVTYLPWRQTRSRFLDDRMVGDGWCPALIWQIGTPCRLVLQYYASLLGRHGVDHRGVAGVKCASGDNTCGLMGRKNTPGDRASKHICGEEERKRCREIKPLVSDGVDEIIERGQIPILEYDAVKAELHVRAFKDGDQYTAISHVWTDGLGNFDGNTMPQCQLANLDKLIRRVPWTNKCLAALSTIHKTWPLDYDPTKPPEEFIELSPDPIERENRPHLFWIDTICVPRPFNARTERTNRLAINNMRLVYLLANNVLVLDSDLLTVTGNLNAEEVLTRISCTNWIRRFWTLQEVVLAKICWFQFADRCYRSLTGPEPLAATYNNEIAYHCQDFNFSWREKCWYTPPLRRIKLVWENLKYRSSYKPEDQAICIATLLDMPIHDIQSIPAAQRLRRLWLFYDQVPLGVLFALVAREQEFPLRWAPASLDGLRALPFEGSQKFARPTSQGLQVTHLGIVTKSRVTVQRKGVVAMQVEDGQVYLVRENRRLKTNPTWDGVDFTIFDKVAVILAVDGFRDADGGLFQRALGALVGVTEMPGHENDGGGSAGDSDSNIGRDTGVIKCQYLRAVSVLLRGSQWEHLGQTWTEQDEKEKTMTVPAAFRPLEQRWLIT